MNFSIQTRSELHDGCPVYSQGRRTGNAHSTLYTIIQPGTDIMKKNIAHRRIPSLLAQTITLLLASQSILAAPGNQHQGTGYLNPGYVNQDTYPSGNVYEIPNLAYYGNWDSNQVFVIDVDNMALVKTVENTGEGPYGIDQQGPSKAYALTRKTESLTIVDNYSFENAGKFPCSTNPGQRISMPTPGFLWYPAATKP